MKTTAVTAAEFSARFGTELVTSGNFSYFVCDNGIGVIRDNGRKSIEIVSAPDLNPADIALEDEQLLLSMICGDFEKDRSVPAADGILEYAEREHTARNKLHWVWTAFGLAFVICLAAGAYLAYRLIS